MRFSLIIAKKPLCVFLPFLENKLVTSLTFFRSNSYSTSMRLHKLAIYSELWNRAFLRFYQRSIFLKSINYFWTSPMSGSQIIQQNVCVIFYFLRNKYKWQAQHTIGQIVTQHQCGYQHKFNYSGLRNRGLRTLPSARDQIF